MTRLPVNDASAVSKVPAVTLLFWVLKILATTLGETAGDTLSMTLNLGYLAATAVFAAVFVVAVAGQILAPRFHPWIYWVTIIATTTVGTTLADFATRSLGIGYAGGSALLLALLLGSLAVWYRTLGTVSVESVRTSKAEMFYWMTIMFSQTLGTALGDWTADTAGLGYGGAAAIFGGLLTLIAAANFRTSVSRTALFWAAFVLTRPLGAVLGDLLDKPVAQGGLAFSRPLASAILLAAMAVCLVAFPQRPAEAGAALTDWTNWAWNARPSLLSRAGAVRPVHPPRLQPRRDRPPAHDLVPHVPVQLDVGLDLGGERHPPRVVPLQRQRMHPVQQRPPEPLSLIARRHRDHVEVHVRLGYAEGRPHLDAAVVASPGVRPERGPGPLPKLVHLGRRHPVRQGAQRHAPELPVHRDADDRVVPEKAVPGEEADQRPEPGGVVALVAEDVAHDGVVGEAVAQDVDDVAGTGWTVEQSGIHAGNSTWSGPSARRPPARGVTS